MSDEQTQSAVDRNTMLRYMITEAVTRELTAALAPYLQSVQVIDGMTRQLNRDYIAHGLRIEDIEELLKGNPDRGIKGLVPTVASLSAAVGEINSGLKLAKILLGVMVALGASDALGITTYIQQLIGIIPK
jgi:hypothetical protein